MPQRDIPLYINTRIINIKSLANPKWFKKQTRSRCLLLINPRRICIFWTSIRTADNKIIPNGFFWSSLAINVLLQSREYSNEPTQNQCSNKEDEITQYSYLHTETGMLMLGIMVLSWLKVNLKKKTENGHCYNSLHTRTETNKSASCSIGSNFHKDLYIDYISILEDFVSSIRACTPTPMTSSNQK